MILVQGRALHNAFSLKSKGNHDNTHLKYVHKSHYKCHDQDVPTNLWTQILAHCYLKRIGVNLCHCVWVNDSER